MDMPPVPNLWGNGWFAIFVQCCCFYSCVKVQILHISLKRIYRVHFSCWTIFICFCSLMQPQSPFLFCFFLLVNIKWLIEPTCITCPEKESNWIIVKPVRKSWCESREKWNNLKDWKKRNNWNMRKRSETFFSCILIKPFAKRKTHYSRSSLCIQGNLTPDKMKNKISLGNNFLLSTEYNNVGYHYHFQQDTYTCYWHQITFIRTKIVYRGFGLMMVINCAY